MHRSWSARKFPRLTAALRAAVVLPIAGAAHLYLFGDVAAAEDAGRHAPGISNFKPPPRWELRPADQPTYPQLLAWARRGQGNEQSVMTLVVRRLMPGTSVQTFAGESAAVKNVPGLSGVRLQTQLIDGFGGKRVQLDGVLEGTPAGAPRRIVRQIYLVSALHHEGYVLTLVTPQAQAVARLRDVEDTAAGLTELATPSVAAPAPATAPAAPPPPTAAPTEGPAQPSESPR